MKLFGGKPTDLNASVRWGWKNGDSRILVLWREL